MADPQHQTTRPRLFPGDRIRVGGVLWTVAAWQSSGGERSVFLTAPGQTARWPFLILQDIAEAA